MPRLLRFLLLDNIDADVDYYAYLICYDLCRDDAVGAILTPR